MVTLGMAVGFGRLSAHGRDTRDSKPGDGDRVRLVPAQAPCVSAIDTIQEADMIAACSLHDDGVPTFPGGRHVTGYLRAPIRPSGGPVVFGGKSGPGLLTNPAPEDSAPRCFRIVPVKPGGRQCEHGNQFRMGAAARLFSEAFVRQGDCIVLFTGGCLGVHRDGFSFGRGPHRRKVDVESRSGLASTMAILGDLGTALVEPLLKQKNRCFVVRNFAAHLTK